MVVVFIFFLLLLFVQIMMMVAMLAISAVGGGVETIIYEPFLSISFLIFGKVMNKKKKQQI